MKQTKEQSLIKLLRGLILVAKYTGENHITHEGAYNQKVVNYFQENGYDINYLVYSKVGGKYTIKWVPTNHVNLKEFELTSEETQLYDKVKLFEHHHALRALEYAKPMVGKYFRDTKDDSLVYIHSIVLDYSHDLLNKGYNSEDKLVFLKGVVITDNSITYLNSLFIYMIDKNVLEEITKEEFNSKKESVLTRISDLDSLPNINPEVGNYEDLISKITQVISQLNDIINLSDED